jgi:hypothetical protein
MSSAKELTPSANNFELFPPTLNTNLTLPPCIWEGESKNICTRTAEQENTILEIYLGYTLAMKHRERIEKILEFDTKVFDIAEQNYYVAITSIDDQNAYSDHLMERLEVYEKETEEVRRKSIIKSIIWGTASTGLGILAGILIGVFVI